MFFKNFITLVLELFLNNYMNLFSIFFKFIQFIINCRIFKIEKSLKL